MSRHVLVIVLLVSCVIIAPAHAQVEKESSWIKSFFSTVPPPETQFGIMKETEYSPVWKWRPIVALPAFKIVESTREDAEVDVFLLTSTGGGISWQKLKWEASESSSDGGKWNCLFSVSPLTVLISGNLQADDPLDISLASSVGVMNNLFMIGGGYDLGQVEGRGRWFGLISIGLNFNN
ncbi:MAG: hypothetical protein Q7W05_14235 [Deltaproteobacteria bacterium]|nr:hypothetical protein [Deltaproteobacteria bacterium]